MPRTKSAAVAFRRAMAEVERDDRAEASRLRPGTTARVGPRDPRGFEPCVLVRPITMFGLVVGETVQIVDDDDPDDGPDRLVTVRVTAAALDLRGLPAFPADWSGEGLVRRGDLRPEPRAKGTGRKRG